MKSPEDIVAAAAEEGRVCPQPGLWNDLWQMLPDRRQVGAGWEPALPLILAAWDLTSDAAKRERFLLHLRWAEARGAMQSVIIFLDSLRPDQWYTSPGT